MVPPLASARSTPHCWNNVYNLECTDQSGALPLRLERLTLREIQLPLREPFRISSGIQTIRRILLLELEDARGAVVWSECVASEQPNYSPETIDTAWLAIRNWVAP